MRRGRNINCLGWDKKKEKSDCVVVRFFLSSERKIQRKKMRKRE